jgi:DNA (cytosine-5)-methyltransferase 1
MPDGQFVTPDIRDAERLQGFEPDWSLPAAEVARNSHRWKLVGNAVSVPVAEWVGTRLSATTAWKPLLPVPFDRRSSWPRAAFSDDGDVWTVEVSSWPVAKTAKPLQQFLRFPTKPLSQRALEGFLSRLSRGNLKRPAAFDRDLQRAIAAAPEKLQCRKVRQNVAASPSARALR